MQLINDYFDKFAVNLGDGLKICVIKKDYKILCDGSIEFGGYKLINEDGNESDFDCYHLYNDILKIGNGFTDIKIGDSINIKRMWVEIDDVIEFKFIIRTGFIDGRFKRIDDIDRIGFYYFSYNLHHLSEWWDRLDIPQHVYRIGSWYDLKWR